MCMCHAWARDEAGAHFQNSGLKAMEQAETGKVTLSVTVPGTVEVAPRWHCRSELVTTATQALPCSHGHGSVAGRSSNGCSVSEVVVVVTHRRGSSGRSPPVWWSQPGRAPWLMLRGRNRGRWDGLDGARGLLHCGSDTRYEGERPGIQSSGICETKMRGGSLQRGSGRSSAG